MKLSPCPLVSFLISTHNRRDILLGSLGHVLANGLPEDQFEIIVVDNASTDGTALAVAGEFPMVRVIHKSQNHGSCAKNYALEEAGGQYVIFLDDDSYPLPGSVRRMVEHFESDPRLGVAGFTVSLRDGTRECSAYPNVFIGCGAGFRRRALDQVGYLPTDFFMQAEEYDLSLRMLDAGWNIQTYEDLHVTHLKTPAGRHSDRTMRLDVRNNIILAVRHLPAEWALQFAADWTSRYRMIATARHQRMAWWMGVMSGLWNAAKLWQRHPIDPWTFETFAKVEAIETRLRMVQEQQTLSRLLFLDLGKNILPYWMAARKLGIQVVAIADNRLAGKGNRYRGISIVDDREARQLSFDASLVANLSPVHAADRRAAWRHMDLRPVIDLFEPGVFENVPSNTAATFAALAWSGSHQTAARIAL